MRELLLLLILFSTNSWADLFDVPLRSFELKSRIQIEATLLNHISAPDSIYIQDTKVQSLGVDEKRPYCVLTKYLNTGSNEEFESFSLDAIEGGYVYAPFLLQTSSFRTTLKLSNLKQFIELSCVNPILNHQKVEELNINNLNSVFGDYLSLESVHINPGNFKPRFAPPITNNFVVNKLKIKLNKDVELLNSEESLNHYEAKVGKCTFFSLTEKITYKKGDFLKPTSYEIVYTNDSMIIQKPTIILRFNDDAGVLCEGNSEKRMFDYQDFWDATGKLDIDWIINI